MDMDWGLIIVLLIIAYWVYWGYFGTHYTEFVGKEQRQQKFKLTKLDKRIYKDVSTCMILSLLIIFYVYHLGEVRTFINGYSPVEGLGGKWRISYLLKLRYWEEIVVDNWVINTAVLYLLLQIYRSYQSKSRKE
jgi:hypothetical protein